jgi:peptidyl-prolyl cis-trans isomerase D
MLFSHLRRTIVLKVIRRGTIENPWFFRIIMGGMAVIFTISMGWWGFKSSSTESENAIAQVDQAHISNEEYQRAYQNASNFYREVFQDKYDDKELRKRVIEELVERRLWLKEAEKMKLVVSDEELRKSVTSLPGFQKEGKFDPELYRRILTMERSSPEHFERKHREELLVEKAKLLVKDAVALTPTEMEEARKANPENPDPDRAISDLLFQKKQRALRGYTIGLKQNAAIQIKEELL